MATERDLASLIVRIQADISDLKKGLSAGSTEVNKFAKETTTSSSSLASQMKSSMKLIGGYIGAAFTVNLVKNFFKESVQAYGSQVSAEALLTNALGKTSDALVKQATALQKLTTYGDEQIISAQAMLANLVKDEEQVKKLTPLVLDLATAKKMDLNSAADLVAKSFASETNALARYGIKLSGAAGTTERMTSITTQLQKAYGGAAQALASTPLGKLERQKNILNDMQELYGKAIIPYQIQWNELIFGAATYFTDILVKLGLIADATQVDRDKLARVQAISLDILETRKAIADLEKAQASPGMSILGGSFDPRALGAKRAELKILLDDLAKAKGAAGIGVTPGGGKPSPSGPSTSKTSDAQLKFVQQQSALLLSQLNAAYEESAIIIDKWAMDSIAAIYNRYEQEKKIIEASPAKDEAERIQKKTDLLGIEIARNNDLATVEQKRIDVKKKLADENKKAEEELKKNQQATKDTLDETRIAGIKDQYARELAELDAKNVKELRAFIEQQSTITQQEELIALQKVERARVVAEQEKKIAADNAKAEKDLYDRRMAAYKSFYSDMASTFKGTYDLIYTITGKKSREMFNLWKTAAIAEAIVNTATAATAAYANGTEAGGPYAGQILGPVFAGVAIANGAIQIATIAAQKMEKGGLLSGNRHSAGGIAVEAEGGEFFEPRHAVNHYGQGGLRFLEAFRQHAIPRDAFSGISSKYSPRMGGSHFAEGGMTASPSGKGEGTSVSIVNYSDPALFTRYLATPEGQRAIVNVVNDRAIRDGSSLVGFR